MGYLYDGRDADRKINRKGSPGPIALSKARLSG
jgi:hypothetical protein